MLLKKGEAVWCSFVGGRNERPCAFGLDRRVTTADLPVLNGGLMDGAGI